MTNRREQSRSKPADSSLRSDRYIVIVEGKSSTSSPYLTLSKALTRLGRAVRLVRVFEQPRREWLRVLRSAEAIVLVHYQTLDAHLFSQLAAAVALDVPIVRWWVGTDVLNVISREDVRRSAARFDRIVSTNVAVAPHLVAELATVGIDAQYVPSVLDPDLAEPERSGWDGTVRPVLVYLPSLRKEFYGVQVVERVIAANADLRFIVTGDDTHSLAAYSNVESLGWVSDMRSVYARAGCILRVTEHDGLPRMLIEGLLRGMYAIYSWPLAGCWEARSEEQINAALARYRTMTHPNEEGRAAMREILSSRPDQKMSAVIGDAAVSLATRGHALGLAVQARFFAEQFR
jgi:hypothetical protein